MFKHKLFYTSLLTMAFCSVSTLLAQQIPITRIEQMPNLPVPYKMRNWKQVAAGYDSLVFNLGLSGRYLPLVWLNDNSINYPEHQSFGLHTVVGTTFPQSAEAINVLPAVIGATLVGIDKSRQNDYNWVLMCEEFFNKRPQENVYLNHPVTASGGDWWYATMPNIFFYQLYDLYPGTGDFNYQFTSVADRWLEAVQKMGGSSTPWQAPNMNYRGWRLATMTPYQGGVPEPEAAGAIAYLLYHAFVETGQSKYRIGAEWVMEFLEALNSNPSYELQLPYGVYTAARMNAELGSQYDIEKMLNWCFNVGPLRQWGAIVGNWGGYDCSGLIGEVNGVNDYAFIMNTFEQAGALLPLVRYDDRFARAMAKWLLNAANAARLFYTNYLPDSRQDSEDWAHQYDPHSYIAHEALRQSAYGGSPYATGDAVAGGWGATNLALYGSSHVGIFGGILDTTNVTGILQLDLLKTDYFHDDAYASYLFFNPYNEAKDVTIDAGSGVHDLYDAVTNQFLQTSVSGETAITIPADVAVLLVLTPAGGRVTYELHKMLIDGVVVDYRSDLPVANHPPRIKSLAAKKNTILINEAVKIYCTASDIDGNPVTFNWSASGGQIAGDSSAVVWTAPDSAGTYVISCQVDDGNGGAVKDSVLISVVERINSAPVIVRLTASPRKLDLGKTTNLSCTATDADGDSLSYTWTARHGSLNSGDSTAVWNAPLQAGNYPIICTVSDPHGGVAVDSIGVVVRDFSIIQTGELVAFYPFNGDAKDESGFNHHGTVVGALPARDRTGAANRAYSFDGVDDRINISNHDQLNFRDAITINFWMRVGMFYQREAYPISHGNWENRWKISITNQRVRWTVKTDQGIKDLDSETRLVSNRFYNITALFSGSDFEIYIDGELDAFSTWSGLILPTSYDLTIGQALPGNNQYNFKGTLDEIRLYNYALPLREIQNLADLSTSTTTPTTEKKLNLELFQNYPNPFNAQTTIFFQIHKAANVRLKIFDVLGKEVKSLLQEFLPAGRYRESWNGTNATNQPAASGLYFYQLQIDEVRLIRKMLLLR